MNSRNLFLHLHPRSCLPPSGWGFSPPCLELLALLQVTLFLKVIPEALLCEGYNKPPIAWVIYHPCTHIYTRARPSPTHIYTHVHVHPLHTYMHTCTSNTCTHIYTRARLPPTDIYTHMHVHPLHTYIHTCTSNPCTLICTSIYIFPRTHPSRIQQQGLYPECILSAEAPQDQATLLTGVTVTLLPALGLSPEARDEGNRPSFSESLPS